MAKNYMEDVAKLLGVELDEEFRIDGGLPFKYKLEKDGLIFWEEGCQKWFGSEMISCLLTGKSKIVKLPKQILTDDEKRYLSNVIEPFRDRVSGITKCIIPNYNDKGFIFILLRSIEMCKDYDYISLPLFDIGTKYRGMKIDKEYTLEELGLV